MRTSRSSTVTNALTTVTSGVASLSSGAMMKLAGNEIRSGYVAPAIFGAISQNTMIRKATMAVAIDSVVPLLPK